MKKKFMRCISSALTAGLLAVTLSACGETQTEKEARAADPVELTINVTADKEWDKNSTPAIAHITGNDQGNTDVDFYHAVTPGSGGNEGNSSIVLDDGSYTIEFISPVNQDGSVYETERAQNISVDADIEAPQSVDCSLTHIPAGQVTDEMLQDIMTRTEEAVVNGDETLTGKTGQDVLAKLENNITVNPNISDETASDTSDTRADKDNEAASAAEKDNNSDSGSTSQSKASNTAGSKSSSSGNTASGASDSDRSSNQSSKPAHTHQWKDHFAQRWVSNWVTVEDTPAQTIEGAQLYTEQPDGTWVSNGETYWFENGFTHDDFKVILKNKIKNEGYIGNYVNRTKTVPAVTHEEDQGYYEKYVDYQYCDCGAEKDA